MIKVNVKFHKGKSVTVEKDCWSDVVVELDNIIYVEDLSNIKSVTIKPDEYK